MSIPISPLAHRTDTWMTDNKEAFGVFLLSQMALPSAHNAGMDKKGLDGAEEGWVACQEDSFLYQLRGGIRVLDLRILKVNNFDYHFYHGAVHSKRRVQDLISDCLTFYREGNGARDGEFIVFNITHAESKSGVFDFKYVTDLLVNGLGGRVLPLAARPLNLEETRQQYPGKTIALCWSEGVGDIWYGLITDWVGVAQASLEEIKSYISSTLGDSEKYPAKLLRSLSVTKFSTLYGPEKIGGAINEWFPASSPWLMMSNVIDVDFFEVSNIVQNCISTNLAKGPPPAPKNLELYYFVENQQLQVRFGGYKDNYNVSHFIVTLNGVSSTVAQIPSQTEMSHSYYLGPNINYTITVRAVSHRGLDSESVTTSGSTGTDPIPGTPDIVLATRTPIGSMDIISVGWTKTLPNGVNIEASIFKADDKDKPIGPAVEIKLLAITASSYTFKNLMPSQRYLITVCQVNVLGERGAVDSTAVSPKRFDL